jgi:hypothetical protein
MSDAPTKPGMLKDVMLLQYSPANRLFLCGRLGVGSKALDKEMKDRGVGSVVEVRYDGRHPSGKLVSPVFLRFRDDKPPDQCYSPISFEKAQFPKEEKSR